MIIGVPKEIKADEYRVALPPAAVSELVQGDGHQVLVEGGAGVGSGFPDSEYSAAGAVIVSGPEEVWERAELITKVKEPVESEWARLRPGQIVFTYMHFAADEGLTRALLRSGAVAMAYETVQLPSGELPLLTPMSEVAGRISVQVGAAHLERPRGGRGVLLGGVPGVSPAEVVVLGGGVVGTHAARIAAGMGAQVRILDTSLPRLRKLSELMPANVELLYSNRQSVLDAISSADLVIGAVLIVGSKAPKLLLKRDLRLMKERAVIVDVAVDQGGCVETIRPSTHASPTYEVDGIIHYGVTNMPGAVPRTSTLALSNATFPYIARVARLGWRQACVRDHALRLGLNVVDGEVLYPGVAEAFDLPLTSVNQVLGVQEGVRAG